VKLWFVTDVFSPDTTGGAGRVAYHLALESSRRHEVHMVTRNPNRSFPPHEYLDDGIHVHRFPVPSVTHPGFLASEIRNSHDLFRTLWITSPPDMVCAHQSLPAIPFRFSPRFCNTPFVYCFYSPWHEEYVIKTSGATGITRALHRYMASLMKIIEGSVVRHAQRIFVISQYTQAQVVDVHQCRARRVVRIPPGVDLDAFRLPGEDKHAVKTGLDWPTDRLVFLTARNLVPRMGLENLITAFTESTLLRRQAILIIDGDGTLRAPLTRMIRTSGTASTIRLMGRVPDEMLIRHYQGADFFILPTRELEGFGLVILESMACGTPVIGTPVGAIPDILAPFDPKSICDGFEARHIREKLEAVVAAPGRFRHSPEECRRFVVDHYSWSRMAQEFEQTIIPLARPGLPPRIR